jgi:hypothetical protein
MVHYELTSVINWKKKNGINHRTVIEVRKEKIKELISEGKSALEMSLDLNVDMRTIYRYLKEMGKDEYPNK